MTRKEEVEKKVLTLSAFLLLTGCGDSNTKLPNQPLQEVPALNVISMALTPLTSADSTSFERHLRNGVYLNSTHQYDFSNTVTTDTTTSVESSRNESRQQSNYSSKRYQEPGVDEGDRIKYDGEFMYIANYQHYSKQALTQEKPTSKTSIRILQRDTEGGIRELSNAIISEEASSINSLYLSKDKLAVLSNMSDFSIRDDVITSNVAIDLFFPMDQYFNLSILDVKNKREPSTMTSYTMEGTIIDSRRVDDVLYVVSSSAPFISGLSYAATESEKLANYKHIFSSKISNFLPQLTDSKGKKKNLVEPEDCYLPEKSTKKDGFNGIITLTAIDLTQPENLSSICINTKISGLYATSSSVYLYGTESQYKENKSIETSVIHKFSITQQHINYIASGTLDGRFNQHLSNLRFSEKGNDLRVVTTQGNANIGYNHRLNILRPVGEQLKIIAQLPNDAHPEKIGQLNKAGIVQEDIKSVRFFENQAFIVTFLNTDPLYVLDVSDNAQLKIMGALEIPGYSSYLHPLSDNLLVGIGENINANSVVGNSINKPHIAQDFSVIEGAKISLFDISNINNPVEINTIIYKDGYTPVEYDYHALTYLAMENGTHRFGLPVEKWLTETVIEATTGNKKDVWSRDNTLQLIEVTGSDTGAILVDKGNVKSAKKTEKNYIFALDDRAIFHGDDIYYLHGNDIWRSFWQTPKLTTGPL